MHSTISVSSPGKVILFGEHAVVYGYPAIACAVDRTITISLDYDSIKAKPFFQRISHNLSTYSVIDLMNIINETNNAHSTLRINSQIPVGCGMGSSAASAVALSALVLHISKYSCSKKKINDAAYAIEKHMHTTPSGVDNTIVCHGGLLRFMRKKGKILMQHVPKAKIPSNLWIVNTGSPNESTAEMVQFVREKRESNPKIIDSYFQKIGQISEQFFLCLRNKLDVAKVSDLICENERLLEKLGIVSEQASDFIRSIEKNGGVAKVSGAGGRNGASGIVMAYHPDADKFHSLMQKTQFEYFSFVQNNTGMRMYES